MRLANMRVLISGASGGIGQCLARQLSAGGAQILALGRDEKRLSTLISSLQPNPDNPHDYCVADLTRLEHRGRINEWLERTDLRPNVLVNLAGTGHFGLFENQSPASLSQLIDTNLTATLQLTQQLLPLLREQATVDQPAQIINVGSILGSIGYPGYVSYCTSKFALRGFSEALQRELADQPIRVKYFAPRATATDFNSAAVNDLNRQLGQHTDSAEQVADALLQFMTESRSRRYLGWPEALWVRINALCPALISRHLKQQLPVIRALASQSLEQPSAALSTYEPEVQPMAVAQASATQPLVNAPEDKPRARQHTTIK